MRLVFRVQHHPVVRTVEFVRARLREAGVGGSASRSTWREWLPHAVARCRARRPTPQTGRVVDLSQRLREMSHRVSGTSVGHHAQRVVALCLRQRGHLAQGLRDVAIVGSGSAWRGRVCCGHGTFLQCVAIVVAQVWGGVEPAQWVWLWQVT